MDGLSTKIFESKVNEFIGLACYLAARYYGVNEIPLGVMEKMLSIAKHLLDVDLPNLDTVITIRGSQHLVRPEGLIAYQKPQYLRNLDSRYFRTETRGHNTFFKPAKGFVDSFITIVGKPYFSEYDSCLRVLLELWTVIKYEGLMLIDMCRLGDGGMSFLVADLENGARWLQRYIRAGNMASQGPSEHNNRFENALDAFRDKTKALQKASDLFTRAKAECLSPRMHSLLHGLVLLQADSVFFTLLQELYVLVSNVGRAIFNPSPDTQDKIHNALKRLSCWSQRQLPMSAKSTESLDQFFTSLYMWLLALSSLSKPELYLEKAFSLVGGERPAIAASDFREFTLKLGKVEFRFRTIGKREVYEWISRVRATVRNWWLIFDGALSATGVEEGDSFFACFPTVRQAIMSSALAVCHLNLLDACSRKAWGNLGCAVKIGVEKRTAARIVNGVDISTAANELFHMIRDLSTQRESFQDGGSLLFAHCSTLQEYDGLRQYVKATMGENILILDHQRIAKSLLTKSKQPYKDSLF